MEDMKRELSVQDCVDKHEKEGKTLVINDGVVVKFERGSGKAGAERAAAYASRICGQRKLGRG